MRRAWRVLALAVVFCALGLVFFFMRSVVGSPSAAVPQGRQAPAAAQDERLYIQGPDPSVFTTFVYNPQKPELAIADSCFDTYYAVLIYAKKVDYRKSPLDARYNVATECPPEKKYAIVLPLAGLPLTPGEEYYVIHAEQGSTGQWYNAR